jgi:arabinofuranosyltransferase
VQIALEFLTSSRVRNAQTLRSINLRLFLLSIMWASTVAFVAWLGNDRQSLGIDDANIFLNYAESLARGDGLMYSIDIPLVEGFTSFLWVIFISVLVKFGGNEFSILCLVIFILAVTHFLLAKVLLHGKDETDRPKLLVAYFVLVSSSAAYSSWMTITLMDITLYGLLIALFTFILIVPNKESEFRFNLALLIFLTAYWVRPEGVVVGLVAFLATLIKWQGRISKVKYLLMLLMLCISVLSLTVFRYIYFGELLPNTYFAKVSPSRAYDFGLGSQYLWNYVSSAILFLAFCVLLGLSQLRQIKISISSYGSFRRFFENSQNLYIFLFLTLVTTLPVLTGGDHFKLFRFFQPSFPLFCILVVDLLYRISKPNSPMVAKIRKRTASRVSSLRKNRRYNAASILLLVAAISTQTSQLSWWWMFRNSSPINHEFAIAAQGRIDGMTLNELFSGAGNSLPSIGVVTAGGISRSYEGPIFDLMGLNNKQMAHFKGARIGVKNHAAFEKSVFYQMEVDVLIADPRNDFFRAIFKDVFAEKEFYDNWDFGVLSELTESSVSYQAFYRKDFLLKMLSTNRYSFVPELNFSVENLSWEKSNN